MAQQTIAAEEGRNMRKTRTGSVIIFHHRAGMDEFEGAIGQLGVICKLLSDDGQLCIRWWQGEV